MVETLIIGQGVFGTLLSWELFKRNHSFCVVDEVRSGSPSRLAAGLINPITGRRAVKSWQIDALIPRAVKTFEALQDFLKIKILSERKILRLFKSEEEKDLWSKRKRDDAYSPYLPGIDFAPGSFEHLHSDFGATVVQRAFTVRMDVLLPAWRQFLIKNDLLMPQAFDHGLMRLDAQPIEYGELKPYQMVFCEGHHACANPYFNWLPLRKNPGERLLVECPELDDGFIYAGSGNLVPLESGLFWFGSTHKWSDDAAPTADGLQQLTTKLNSILKLPWEIVDHKCGIRPSVKDRRPVVGQHPRYKSLYILNGLGTKGASLGPHYAHCMAENLQSGADIPASANINRFMGEYTG